MTTKPRRHLTQKIVCESCGKEFDSLLTRMKEGRGKFCSSKCFGVSQKKGKDRKYVGKENGKAYINKHSGRCVVYWFDPDTLVRKTTTYAKWYIEVHRGPIPRGCRAVHLDGDQTNINPENIGLQTSEEFGQKLSNLSKGKPKSEEAKENMRKAAVGKKLSEEHKQNIGKASHIQWENGVFDKVHFGKYNHHWRGGSRPYPSSFNDELRNFIRDRDKNRCQSCGKDVSENKKGHVHHIDGNKHNNDDRNLILLCLHCHAVVHLSECAENDAILYLRSQLIV